MADQGFLESASLRLRFTIVNLKNEPLTPCAPVMSMFRRARLFAASQLVEDLTLLPNQTTLRDRMLPLDRRVNNSIEANPMDNNEVYMEIGNQASRKVITPLPFGTINQPSWLPVHLISGGLVLEFELDEKCCIRRSGGKLDSSGRLSSRNDTHHRLLVGKFVREPRAEGQPAPPALHLRSFVQASRTRCFVYNQSC